MLLDYHYPLPVVGMVVPEVVFVLQCDLIGPSLSPWNLEEDSGSPKSEWCHHVNY